MAVKIEMDMPKSCSDCNLRGFEDTCSLVGYDCVLLYREERHPKCPLKEIK